jgi:hypothetical protein
MHVIARHQLGYGTQAGISLAADDSRAHRVRDRRVLKAGPISPDVLEKLIRL